jgi:hypothetical protein
MQYNDKLEKLAGKEEGRLAFNTYAYSIYIYYFHTISSREVIKDGKERVSWLSFLPHTLSYVT